MTIVGIALLAVGPWCFYTFYYLKSEENHPLIGEQRMKKGEIRYSFSLLKKNFLCSFVKVLSPRMEVGLPYAPDVIY